VFGLAALGVAVAEVVFGLFLSRTVLTFVAITVSLLCLRTVIRTRFVGIFLWVLFLALLWLYTTVPLSPRQAFLNDLRRVRAGMTSEQVRSVMGHYLSGTGWPANTLCPAPREANGTLVLHDSCVYRYSEQQSDWGIVAFREGHVVDVSFSPD